MRDSVVIITGAGRGIGEACGLAFADEGARVALVDRYEGAIQELERRINSSGGSAISLVADVTDSAAVSSAVERVVSDCGGVDVLINNAGVLKSTTPLESIDPDEWDLVMDVNVKGMFLFSKYVLPSMKKRGGSIVNIASSAGRSTSELGGAHYTASKAAVLGLTRHLAREYAQYGITVNSICPGLVETPMIREEASTEKLEHWLQQIPVGRFAKPSEVADTVLFLSSERARYICGATIDFNGGSLLI